MESGEGVILAILQARTSSVRLPGKVLKPILCRPMLSMQIERVLRAVRLDQLVVATSVNEADQAIEDICAEMDIACFRGSLDDVLDRFYQAALEYSSVEHVVRLTGDCPLADPEIIDGTIDYYLENRFDYVSNALEPTFPDGLDVEIFRFSSLEKAWKESFLKHHREHVTPFIYSNPEKFRIGKYCSKIDLSHHRWSVDEPDDFEVIQRIFEALYPSDRKFTTVDVIDFLKKNPYLAERNAHITRNEGYRRDA